MSSSQQRNKIINLIKAICSRVKEKEGYVNKTKLIKFLYLIDVEYYRNHTDTFTGFKWVFYDFGPWAYEYNDIFGALNRSPDFRIEQSQDSDFDTSFISTSAYVEFESVFEKVDDELIARRIVDRWADERLNAVLNYVYFKTEPMVDAERYKPLDFRKIHSLESIPDFKLTKSTRTEKEKRKSRKKIEAMLEKLEEGRYTPTNFTPPNYDDVYFKAMAIMDKDGEY